MHNLKHTFASSSSSSELLLDAPTSSPYLVFTVKIDVKVKINDGNNDNNHNTDNKKNEHNSKNYNDFANVEKSKEIILNLEEHRGLIW